MPPLTEHKSVLLNECLEYLAVTAGKTYIDCTLGAGGHSSPILAKLEGKGKLISLDQDQSAIDLVSSNAQTLNPDARKNWQLIHRNFAELEALHQELKNQDPEFKIDGGVLIDLGVSSMQFDQADRGFSFSKDAPLDMRMDQSQDFTAADLLNSYPEPQIADILYTYGDERFSRYIARAIVNARPLHNTIELAELVKRIYVQKTKSRKTFQIHPATRTFQALRVYVNHELEALAAVLEAIPKILEPNARVVVISFQSQEDRLVKHCFRQRDKFSIITKKPVVASSEEEEINPRSRSAKLRAAIIKTHEHQQS